MKKTILFVDDEVFVLAGLKRCLAAHRERYDFLFASGGEEALHRMQERQVDVLVTDIIMPDMTGLRLLEETARRFPGTARVVLSGQMDDNTAEVMASMVHGFLAKPCETALLLQTLDQVSGSVSTTLSDAGIRKMLNAIETLPSPPTVYFQLRSMLEGEQASLQEIARLIAGDMSLASKILKVVNSSFFGIAHKVSSIQQATVLLGVNIIKSLTLSCHVTDQFHSSMPQAVFSIDRLAENSILTGTVCMEVTQKLTRDKNLAEESFSAGILHALGLLILAQFRHEAFAQALVLARKEALLLEEAEIRTLGVTHAQVGAALMEIWGLPETLVTAVRGHLVPPEPEQFPLHSAASILKAVYCVLRPGLEREYLSEGARQRIEQPPKNLASLRDFRHLQEGITLILKNRGIALAGT